jgi:hypothetical protein
VFGSLALREPGKVNKLTAMRMGVYAILAVVVGAMLVGLLPGQLSNVATPAKDQTANLQLGVVPESKLNRTSTSADAVKTGSGSSTANISGANTLIPPTSSGSLTSTQYGPYTDLEYYALWGIGLIAAFSVYLLTKRMLG